MEKCDSPSPSIISALELGLGLGFHAYELLYELLYGFLYELLYGLELVLEFVRLQNYILPHLVLS
jgi:hypothetical protein